MHFYLANAEAGGMGSRSEDWEGTTLVLRRAKGRTLSPQSQRVRANLGASGASGQLLVGPGAEADGSSGATLDEGPLQAD